MCQGQAAAFTISKQNKGQAFIWHHKARKRTLEENK
jgi:hypothetical protein